MTMVQPPRATTHAERLLRVRAALREAGVPSDYHLDIEIDRVLMVWSDGRIREPDFLAALASTFYRALFLAGELAMCWSCFSVTTPSGGCGPFTQQNRCRAEDHPIEWLTDTEAPLFPRQDPPQVQQPVDHLGVAPHLTSLATPEPRFH